MHSVIGVDMGGTKMEAARIECGKICESRYLQFDASASEQEVLASLFECIEACMSEEVSAIGVGVPGLIDYTNSVVCDLINVRSWKEVDLKSLLVEQFGRPVRINNDANCFVLGEKYHGCARAHDSVAGVTIGTGIGVGLILNNQLYTGRNCGAGELGQMPYLDEDFEAYCSGDFFEMRLGCSGVDAYKNAIDGCTEALSAYAEFGHHLGKAISNVLLAYDPGCIVIGGSISDAYSFFIDSLMVSLQEYPYQRVLKTLTIMPRSSSKITVFGAGSLWGDKQLETNNYKVVGHA